MFVVLGLQENTIVQGLCGAQDPGFPHIHILSLSQLFKSPFLFLDPQSMGGFMYLMEYVI